MPLRSIAAVGGRRRARARHAFLRLCSRGGSVRNAKIAQFIAEGNAQHVTEPRSTFSRVRRGIGGLGVFAMPRSRATPRSRASGATSAYAKAPIVDREGRPRSTKTAIFRESEHSCVRRVWPCRGVEQDSRAAVSCAFRSRHESIESARGGNADALYSERRRTIRASARAAGCAAAIRRGAMRASASFSGWYLERHLGSRGTPIVPRSSPFSRVSSRESRTGRG